MWAAAPHHRSVSRTEAHGPYLDGDRVGRCRTKGPGIRSWAEPPLSPRFRAADPVGGLATRADGRHPGGCKALTEFAARGSHRRAGSIRMPRPASGNLLIVLRSDRLHGPNSGCGTNRVAGIEPVRPDVCVIAVDFRRHAFFPAESGATRRVSLGPGAVYRWLAVRLPLRKINYLLQLYC
jgi:hypothetical protein